MSFWISFLNDFAVSIFGSVLSAFFCDALATRRNRRIFVCCMILIPLLQVWVYILWVSKSTPSMFICPSGRVDVDNLSISYGESWFHYANGYETAQKNDEQYYNASRIKFQPGAAAKVHGPSDAVYLYESVGTCDRVVAGSGSTPYALSSYTGGANVNQPMRQKDLYTGRHKLRVNTLYVDGHSQTWAVNSLMDYASGKGLLFLAQIAY